jgi:hypothetical protein
MSSFTSVAAPEEYNDDHKPLGKPAHRDRRIEFSRDDHSAAQRVLREAVEHQQVGLEGLQAARLQLLKLFARIERLGEQIDEAFAGRPFLPNLPADAPANRRRFNTFLQEHKQVTKLLGHALELWMLTCGMKRDDDWVPVIIEDMRLKGAKARNDTAKPGSGPLN